MAFGAQRPWQIAPPAIRPARLATVCEVPVPFQAPRAHPLKIAFEDFGGVGHQVRMAHSHFRNGRVFPRSFFSSAVTRRPDAFSIGLVR
jgi:hypothetical protein